MKKIITLLGAVLLVASSFAQYDSRDNKRHDNDVAYNDGKHKDHDNRRGDDRYNNNYRERDMQIAKINREYDRKIESVQHRWFMSHSRKQELIYQLEDQRRYEIRKVYARFNQRNDRWDDHDRDHDHGAGRHW